MSDAKTIASIFVSLGHDGTTTVSTTGPLASPVVLLGLLEHGKQYVTAVNHDTVDKMRLKMLLAADAKRDAELSELSEKPGN